MVAPTGPIATSDFASTLYPWLTQQSEAILNRLYSSPSTCLSIFRLLPPLPRQLLTSLLWLPESRPIPMADLAAWLKRGAEPRKRVDEAMGVLGALHLAKERGGVVEMNAKFRENMRRALTGGGSHRSFGVPSDSADKHYTSIAQLDDYATEQWETMLHFMVGSTDRARPSVGVLYLLEKSGLMAKPAKNSPLLITSRGFQFLLEDVQIQLWDLLLQYLSMAEERQMDLVEVLNFLFMLGTLELGRDYSSDTLTPTQQAMLADLRDWGLVYQRQSKKSKQYSRRFYPTRLATTLTSSAPPLLTSSAAGADKTEQKGFIILETNYRLYAYTSNPLQISVLNLFVHLKSRFPNLVTGVITRESVKNALSNGITADQVISYLKTHAHPQMHRNNPLLPVTVQDQIRLWENERNRLKDYAGTLYSDFRSPADYELVLNYAKQIDVVLWESAAKRMLFVTAEGHQAVREYIMRRTQGGGSAVGTPGPG